MPSTDPTIRDHQAWLGYLQPDGLVVSPVALKDAQVVLDKGQFLPLQNKFLPFVHEVQQDDGRGRLEISDFGDFVCRFLEWPAECLVGLTPDKVLPETLAAVVGNYSETLAPSFAFRQAGNGSDSWHLLAKVLPSGTDLDARTTEDERTWSASQHQRFERLLRETKVPIGLLTNRAEVRLVYAPEKENAGSITFPVGPMTEVAGRPILAAFDLLLNRYRLLAAGTDERLPALLQKSRDYQSSVSTKLAEQVLDALYELLRGFQAADERTKGELLRDILAKNQDEVYSGLLSVLLRMVFLLFAEDRGITPTDPKTKRSTGLYVRNYSIHGLYERLRSDDERHPDTMNHRYGAWGQLLALFRVVHRGCKHKQLNMPARGGNLFDPDRFRFLEGRTCKEPHIPLVSDGVVYRVLQKLLTLDGERLSYRTLDVEQIGSVYQTVMGFRLEVTAGPSIAIIGKRKGKGSVPAPTVINLENLLAEHGKDRSKWLREQSDQEVSGEAADALKAASTADELESAMERKIARNATPTRVPKGTMVLQPTDERRRSGSHYTPRAFTKPVVEKTLQPIVARLAAC